MTTKTKHILIVLLLAALISFGIFQSVVNFKTEEVSAVTTGTPNPGHAWSSMECSGDTLCIDPAGSKLGIGTNTPSQKLEVNGNIKLSGASPSYTISNVAAPISSSDVATKDYVDAAGGFTPKWATCYVSWLHTAGAACASGYTTLAHWPSGATAWVTDGADGATNAKMQVLTIGNSITTYSLLSTHWSYSCGGLTSGVSDWLNYTIKPLIMMNGMCSSDPDVTTASAASSMVVCCK